MRWWPEAEWERMRAGVDCPMCADAHLPANAHSDLITESATSFIRLHRNQTQAGYSVVISKRHVAELHELAPAELQGFVTDIARVGRAVGRLFGPVKLDTLIMGHLCPHLHCHVYPQYGDDDPHALVDIQRGSVRLSGTDQQARIDLLRRQLTDASRSNRFRGRPNRPETAGGCIRWGI